VIRHAFALALFCLCLGAFACQRVSDDPHDAHDPSSEDASEPESHGQVQRYVFGTIDGQELSAEGMHGRVTVLLFVTTFDLASQLAAKQLNQVFHTHRPRINAGAVVVEAAKYAPLADVFRSTLELSYPVAIADLDTLQRNSTLGEVRSVPTLIILDAQGREMLRKTGNFSPEELNGWLARGERQ
jgi:hypothetical protein